MGLWNTLKNLWRRWTGQATYRGPTLTENEITDRLGDRLGEVIGNKAPNIVRQIAVEANNAGLSPDDWPYLYWLIASQKDHWPSMSDTFTNALLLARDVMVKSGQAPAYHAAVKLPPSEDEDKVDEAVKKVALWAATTMNSEILRKYIEMLDYYEPAMQKITAGELPANKARVYLQQLFEAQLERFPARWATGDYLDQWLFGVLK